MPVTTRSKSISKITELLAAFLCPITCQLMVDPVIDLDGHSYERTAIEDWLKRKATSPITRSPLSAADLRPNGALKRTIDEYRHSLKSDLQSDSCSMELEPSSELSISVNYASGFAHLSIQPPADASRSPCDICCVVDTSGSMSAEAEIQNDDNEKYGLSQLELVRHALKTIVHSLTAQDRMSLVSFSSHATVLFQLTKMDEDGKTSALAALERLKDNGNTNLWDGLRTGLEILSEGQRPTGSNSALFLLTDGCPNVEPPGGHLPTLEAFKKNTNFACPINTFGFGYQLDSKLLEDISIMGNAGLYAFIPDGSFVGTIFVNAISTLLTTIATNVQLHVHGQSLEPSDYTKWYSTNISPEGTSFDLGSIVYGQSKDLLIPLPLETFSNCKLSLTYDTPQKKKKFLTLTVNGVPQQDDAQIVAQHKFRLEFVHCVRTVLETMRGGKNNSASTKNQQETAKNRLKALETAMKKYAKENEFVKDLLIDLSEQVQQAITRPDWFQKWGVHFLPSLTRAHLLQHCNNFKDPGVQHYGRGILFSEVRDEMDGIFCGLPAPKRTQKGAKIDMSVFYNAAGGCFHGACTVRLINGTVKLVKDVRPGDRMAPYGGLVTYVVKTTCQDGKAKMVVLENGLIITAWHPIRLHNQWIMPCSLVSAPSEISCETVYNFALDQGHTVLINDVECVTLGHGFQEDVVRHSYYGSQRVIEDLRRLDVEQTGSGLIEISEETLVRNHQTGLISGLRLGPGQKQQQPVPVF